MSRTSFLVLLSLFLAPGPKASASPCGCPEELAFVVRYIETNLPGFGDNVDARNAGAYQAFKDSLAQAAQGVEGRTSCYKLLVTYVEFFRDSHTSILMRTPALDTDDPAAVAAFLTSEAFTATPVHELRPEDEKQYGPDDIRGIYRTADSTYTIAIIPRPGIPDAFQGVVLESRTPVWKRGQVKMELQQGQDGTFTGFVYMRDHSPRYQARQVLKDGVLDGAWTKTSVQGRGAAASDADGYKALDDSTAYIRITSFDGSASAHLDSLYTAAHATIVSRPYLIIDVRGNGGGSDLNAWPLVPYFYSRPIPQARVEDHVTADNIRTWEALLTRMEGDTANYGAGNVRAIRDRIARMRAAPSGSFIPIDGDTVDAAITLDSVARWPRKVAILADGGCASSCESLLLWALESDKAVIMGANSGGFLAYGEVGRTGTPCFDLDLYTTMTRHHGLGRYEAIGIPPAIRLDDRTDQVMQAVGILKGAR